MKIDTEVEKLNIDERKIIRILLKQLMYQQNELAYIKNKTGLNSENNGIGEKGEGSSSSIMPVSENKDGSSSSIIAVPKNKDGGNSIFMAVPKNKGGDKSSIIEVPKNKDGSSSFTEAVPKNKDGSSSSIMPVLENKDGGKSIFMAAAENKDGSKSDFWLYTAFEQELINALEQYIKNGNGQNSLYSFYTDFEDAVEQKNTDAIKMKEAENNLTLEDTHILPKGITVDDDTIDELADTLRDHLPRTSPWKLYKTVACELLHLYNIGKASATQMRGFAGLSVSGIAKHLPKLQRADLIKKQPPNNYVLTEKSIHILLETFGVEK